MRKKSFLKELMLPAFWVFVFVVSSHGYETVKNSGQDLEVVNTDMNNLKKMSNYSKSQARYLWFYILPDVSGNRLIKQGI